MQLTPRYDGPAVLVLGGPAGDPSMPLLRQRRRLAAILGGLDDQQWRAPTRCEHWSVQDVIAHLISTNQFWTVSIAAGLAGEPTRYLASFDPVATPPQMVDPMRAMTPAEVLARYEETVEALADVVTGLDEAAWSLPAEAPPGHVSMYAVSLHALWDAWIHERDVVLPLGLAPVIEPDEVAACLRYAAAVGPTLRASTGSTRRGHLALVATDPDVAFVIEAGTSVVVVDGPGASGGPCITGDAVALVEGFSFRGPLEHGLTDADAWLVGGLDEVFDVAAAPSV